MSMDLKDFLPKKTEVKLCRLDKKLLVMPFSLADDAWMETAFTVEQIEGLTANPDPKIILQIFWRLLDNESKKYIGAHKVIDVDEMGVEKELANIPGHEKLFHLVSGIGEMVEILNAIAEAKNLSSPKVREAIEEGIKKKKALAGNKSLTSSAQNMDGQSIISLPEQCEKSTDLLEQSESEKKPS